MAPDTGRVLLPAQRNPHIMLRVVLVFKHEPDYRQHTFLTPEADMAVIGIGLDLVERARIERALNRFDEAFLARILSAEERRRVPQGAARRVDFVAARFAAKEAAAKALGTGFANGIGPRDFEILSLPSGAPHLRLSGAALEQAKRLDVSTCHLTLTHSTTHAAAVVILETASLTSSRI